MALAAYQFQIDEVEALLGTQLSEDERQAAELQLSYLRQERMVMEDFERCTMLQRNLIKIAQQEEADEDVARGACHHPLRDHTLFRQNVSRLNDVLSIRCRVIDSDEDDVESESEATSSESEPTDGLAQKGPTMKVGGRPLSTSKSNQMEHHSATFKGMNIPSSTGYQECAVCAEKRLIVYKFPCGHIHCKDCTSQIFRRALDDRSLLPVRCCKQEADQSLSLQVLPSANRKRFDLAVEEARATNKMYCPRKECGAFINLDKVGTGPKLFFACPRCFVSLCSACRASHPGLTCTQHASLASRRTSLEDAAFLQLAADKKYARCNRCRSYVELALGCNHMTCPCRHEFCYRCNATWKNCGCPTWDEANLVQAGRERAGIRAGNERVVRRYMRNLIRVEECAAHRWDRINSGRRNCENCHFFMYVYHYKCSECNQRVCYTCRFHRL